jgi:Prenyltransferase and squalene oxidase repeat
MKLRYYAVLTPLLLGLQLASAEPTTSAPPQKKDSATETTTPPKDATPPKNPTPPKPLSPVSKKGIDWLIKSQHKDGGWGQGGGWRINTSGQGGRVEGENINDPSDIANTAIVLQCLLRSGITLKTGENSEAASRAADFLIKEISKADDDTLYVTAVRDTQIQSKIGRYVDTFLAAQILADLKDKMPTPESEKKRGELLDRVTAKIQKHQKDNGAFEGNNGWAATLSQGLCSRALNSAWGAGAKVDVDALKKDHKQNAEGLDRQSGVVAPSAVGDAGVEIYRYASKIGGMTQFSSNNTARRDELEKTLKSPASTEKAKEETKKELAEIKRADEDKDVLLNQVAAQVKNERFVAGFGNNGGEEFLSFINIGEALHAKGGDDWIAWEKQMGESIAKAQNEDGSWAGHHCITGRTFCTATALMVLMSDRAPIQAPAPIAANTEKPATPNK